MENASNDELRIAYGITDTGPQSAYTLYLYTGELTWKGQYITAAILT